MSIYHIAKRVVIGEEVYCRGKNQAKFCARQPLITFKVLCIQARFRFISSEDFDSTWV